ncbi:hypothetical protein [Lysinibacillus capsici]|uniref:hypothetical protein n=1 Tax=Lysinibacillus capsici TaxID=2115968 RepID=UPI00215300F4|nr:hypothetical protein [Lysinibacillus capsici]MCR6522300.1 hypothetical protein [Lysinibacillus capsici]
MTAAITLELEKETTQIQETFSFEQLGMNEQLPSNETKKQIDRYVIVSTYPLASF